MLIAAVVATGLTVAAPAMAAGTYSTTAAVNVRTGPSTSYAVIATEPKGASFVLLCQWQGGTNVNGNATWDYVRFGNGVTGTITDYWTTSPSWNNYAPNTGACGASTPPPPPPGPLATAGVDMQRACTQQYGSGWTAVVLDIHNAYSWKCVAGANSNGIDVNRACVTEYRLGATSGLRNASDAYSWYCQWHTPPVTARNIGYNPFAALYSNQCTYYAEVRMARQTGLYMPVFGNAYQWTDEAAAGGWTVGAAPLLFSVAVFPAGAFNSSVGHVAFVVAIQSGQLLISDYNWAHVGAVVTTHWVTPPAGTRYIYSDR